MRKTIGLLTLMLPACLSAQPFHPFPVHSIYTAGSIRPDNYSQAQLDNQVKNFYDKWKARYVVPGCDASQYYIWYNDLGYDGNNICVSEGQGYGMVIEALMAGYDAGAKTYFDGLYRWYKAHPSKINPVLMNWRQKEEDCKSNGHDAATDGDMDIAFGLLLADKQWGSNGDINYLQEAINIINAIMQSEVYSQSVYSLQLGDWAHESAAYKNGTRPSDFMYDHLRAFQAATGNNKWNKVLNECYSLISTIQQNFSPVTGLIPDFIVHTDGAPAPAPGNYLESEFDGAYNYNSCRVPWHLGCAYLVNGDTKAKRACNKINAWIKSTTGGNPHNIHGGYYLDGTDLPDNNYEDLSFIAPFGVSAMVNGNNQAWLNVLWENMKEVTKLKRDGYYGNTIKMICMIIMSGNWWSPEQAGLQQKQSISQSNAGGGFIIFPNPLKGNMTFRFTAEKTQSVQLYIYDANGRIVYSKNKHTQKGYNEFRIQIPGPASGNYFLFLHGNDLRYTTTFIVQ